jgi:hypothetical protein
MLKANPGFALTDSGTMKFGGTVAQFYTFVGQDRRLPEPEKTVMFVVANSEALVTDALNHQGHSHGAAVCRVSALRFVIVHAPRPSVPATNTSSLTS